MTTEVSREAQVQLRRALKQESPPTRVRDTDSAAAGASTTASVHLRRAARSQVIEHVVFLLPGLLGFERFANFGYFADRVAAALRASLEQRLGHSVPVVPVPSPPTASLRARQRKLVKTLADRLHGLEHDQGPMRVHLVGHSTGGVDANLLTRVCPIGGGVWDELDPRAALLRSRIDSVVCIASPHQGACIVRDDAARMLSHRELRDPAGMVKLVGQFLLSAAGDMTTADLAGSFVRELRKSRTFLVDVLGKWELLGDLEPASAPAQLVGLDPRVMRRSFVTMSGTPESSAACGSPPDAFFRSLSERASGNRTGCAEIGQLVQASVARLREALSAPTADEYVIGARGISLPRTIDAGHNDGVVNSARQLIDPYDPDELAGIVVADHFDVVGHYDRVVWSLDDDGHEQRQPLLSGLLHSGSCFRDDQFFELYARVADQLVAGIEGRKGGTP